MAYGAYGRSEVVEGRDLTAVRHLVGTGGALTRLGPGLEILRRIKRDPRRLKLLPPPDAAVYLDRNNVMAAVGVFSRRYPQAAKKLLLESIGYRG